MTDRTPLIPAHPLRESIGRGTISNKSSEMPLCDRSVASIKQEVVNDAMRLEARYNEKRAEMSNLGFCNLNFRLRIRNANNIQIEWYLSHFKNGIRSGTTSIKKSRSSHSYDLRHLKGSSPEWMHPLVEHTEFQAREIRKKIATLAKIYALLTTIDSAPTKNKITTGSLNITDSYCDDFMDKVF